MISINGFEIPLAAIAGFTSAFIAAIAAMLVWLQWRERSLRQDDVLKWAIEAIRNLQTLYLTTYLGDAGFTPAEGTALRSKIAVDTSVLVEQGRMYFKNTPHDTHGADQFPAYRGFRPMILDPLVVAHQIACQWDKAPGEKRDRMVVVAQDCVRNFVSMAQREVGRGRTAHMASAIKGEGERLDVLLSKVKPERLATLKTNARLSL